VTLNERENFVSFANSVKGSSGRVQEVLEAARKAPIFLYESSNFSIAHWKLGINGTGKCMVREIYNDFLTIFKT
jgi:hypothetical protein